MFWTVVEFVRFKVCFSAVQLKCEMEPMEAVVGEKVILPCFTELPEKVETVEWTVTWTVHLQDHCDVHLFRENKNDLQDQCEDYRNKTSLVGDVSKGNCSLRLLTTANHSGMYRCSVRINESDKYKCSINLTGEKCCTSSRNQSNQKLKKSMIQAS